MIKGISETRELDNYFSARNVKSKFNFCEIVIISCFDQAIGAPDSVIIQLHPAASYPRLGARNDV